MIKRQQRARRIARSGQVLCLAALLFQAGCGGQERPGTQPRHVLLISAANVRGDHVTALGYQRHTTGLLRLDQPIVLDLDRVGDKGVFFAKAFVPSSDDQISLTTLMAGSLPITDEGLGLRERGSTLAEDFTKAGFITGGFFNASSLGETEEEQQVLARGFSRSRFVETDEDVLTAAVEWLVDRSAEGESLFTCIHLGGVARPFAGDTYSDIYSVTDYEGPVRGEAAFFEELAAGEHQLTERDRRRLVDLYDARLVRLSELVNSFFYIYMNDIADGTLWADTLIAFTGTSGCELAERGVAVERDDSLEDASLHVPLLLSHPNSLTGERILGSVVELTDLSATLRDMFGLSNSEHSEGRSLLRLTDSYIARDFPERAAFSLSSRDEEVLGVSIRTPRWRLSRTDKGLELFDLQHDPAGLQEVSAAYPEELDSLQRQLDERCQAIGLGRETP
jgi:hypothetical protein